MNLDEKSKKIKDGLEKLGKKYKCTVNLPDSLDEYAQEWRYFISHTKPDGFFENVTINVHEKYIDVFICPPDIKRFNEYNSSDEIEEVKNALEEVEGLLKSLKQASDT